MNEDRFLELINREIDQELTAEESCELETFLEHNPELAARRAELQKMSNLLDGVEDAEPPKDMKANILRHLRAKKAKPSAVISISPGFRGFWSKLGLRFAYSFAGGAVVGAALLALIIKTSPISTPLDTSDLTGTIVFGTVPEGFTTLDRSSINTDEVVGSIEIGALNDLVIARLEVASDNRVDLLLQYEPDQLAVTGFNRLESVGNSTVLAEREIRLAHSGSNCYSIIWSSITTDSTTIRITISSDVMIYEANLIIPLSGGLKEL